MKSVFACFAVLVLVLALASPAFAHVLVVTPPGGDVKVGWTGGPALPAAAKGKGLVPGGPTGSYMQSPAHGGGLNTACESLRSNPSQADMFGPPVPQTCRHGF
jgi:hypothetical protein